MGLYDSEFEAGAAQFNVWRELVSPMVLGVENLPPLDTLNGRSLLFVGNHTQFGTLPPCLAAECSCPHGACQQTGLQSSAAFAAGCVGGRNNLTSSA